VFNDRLYIYPSHDWESGIPENDNGDHFNMKDYHVFSTDDPMKGEIVDHGLVLTTEDIPWAGRQLWDCDVAEKDGKYYMYFPLKDQNDIFRIGVAISDGAAIAREVADITVSADDLYALLTLKRLSDALMERIHSNYRKIISFNFLLICLGVAGVLPPATSALLHNVSTLAISLKSMTKLLP